MSKYITIVILYQSHFYNGSKINILPTEISTYTTFEMELPGYKYQDQCQIAVWRCVALLAATLFSPCI